jgi:hypothetical protein
LVLVRPYLITADCDVKAHKTACIDLFAKANSARAIPVDRLAIGYEKNQISFWQAKPLHYQNSVSRPVHAITDAQSKLPILVLDYPLSRCKIQR